MRFFYNVLITVSYDLLQPPLVKVPEFSSNYVLSYDLLQPPLENVPEFSSNCSMSKVSL